MRLASHRELLLAVTPRHRLAYEHPEGSNDHRATTNSIVVLVSVHFDPHGPSVLEQDGEEQVVDRHSTLKYSPAE